MDDDAAPAPGASSAARPASEASPPDYPAEWECDVVLSDGGTLHVRPVRPGDEPALADLHARMSRESRYLRYFTAHSKLRAEELARMTGVDYESRMGLVAFLRDQSVALASYHGSPGSERAEVAFAVADAHQGRGLGTLLLEHLAAYAWERGIRTFTADVLPANRGMLRVFHDAGFAVSSRYEGGVVRVELGIAPTRHAREAVQRREWTAEARSVERLLRPRSVAVIGAGPEPGGVGHAVLRNLQAGGFTGALHPVHPSAPEVLGLRARRSVLDVPGEVDLAVVAVPADQVIGVAEQCAEKQVGGIVVVSAGFAETGPEGAAAERELVRAARGGGMRLVGPNCLGILNTHPDVRLNATFGPPLPAPGRVACLSQSGAIGIAVLETMRRLGLGLSSFASVGNKADVSGNDFLEYWAEDPDTELVLLYLESFGNPRKFSRVARRLARRKPIVAVKGGRSRAGSRAASSHTAALSCPDLAVDALFRQAGVIRVETFAELLDVAQLLALQPLPRGRRVAIVGNSGGPGILAADACEAGGLEVPELAPAVRERLQGFLPAGASARNPVDLVASADAARFERALECALDDPGIDAAIAVFTATPLADAGQVAAALASVAARRPDRTLLANFVGRESPPPELRGPGSRGVPCFAFPESAARALARVADYASWRARPEGRVPRLRGLQRRRARRAVEAALAAHPDGCWLDPVAAALLVGAYGIPAARTLRAESAGEAERAAAELGGAVVLKAAAAELIHKTDQGGVRLSLESPGAAREAFEAMERALGPRMGGAVVQPMLAPGVELLVGVVQEGSFGPLVLFALGGVAAELLRDRSFRSLPLTDLDARELVRSLRASPLLFGYRGAPACDVAALEDLVLRVAALAEDLPEMAELDLSPVIAGPSGAVAVDVKVRLAQAPARPELGVRRLRG
jgi:acetyl coenzyme A synthetase (ADP forming)-like protein